MEWIPPEIAFEIMNQLFPSVEGVSGKSDRPENADTFEPRLSVAALMRTRAEALTRVVEGSDVVTDRLKGCDR